MDDNNTHNTDDSNISSPAQEIQHVRRSSSRAPRRREQQYLSGTDMAHISESLEESIADYEHPAHNRYADRNHYAEQNRYIGRDTGAEKVYRHSLPQDTNDYCDNNYEGTRGQAGIGNNNSSGDYKAEDYKNLPSESEHYEAEAANMEALREAQRLRNADKYRQLDTGRRASASSRNSAPAQNQAPAQNSQEQVSSRTSVKNNTSEAAGYNAGRAEKPDRKHGNADKAKKRRHPVLKLLLLLLVLGVGFVGYKFITGQSGYYTVAVFGVDSRNGNVGKEALSDVNIIARIDRSSGEIKLVSLYRDTYTKINSDGTYHKLNEAYFRGGPEQAIWAVEHNTDVDIDDYATFNWKAVADAINILGGIDLEITDAEFKYINAFITETVNSTGVGSHQLEHAGANHLDGVQAVAYARLRLMDTDYQRTARQRKVIGLALDKAKNADYATLLNILTTVMPQISTSVTPDDLIPFMKGVSKYYISDTAGFPFDKATQDIGKLDCVIPVTLESNAVKLHEFLYPDTPYMPSSELKDISNHIINVTGLSG